MTVVSNDPTWGPIIYLYRRYSQFVVAAFVAVLYDWALTFGQEVELIWRQRWSLMTVMYLSVRYLGILYAALGVLNSVPTISLTDTGCFILYVVRTWMGFLAFSMLWVIIITRLHAMYQRSRKILISLAVTFLIVTVFDGAASVKIMIHTSAEELIISDTYQCSIDYLERLVLLDSIIWISCTVWEVLALCLAIWIAVKHFRELRQHSAGGIINDCFVVLIRSHVVYFASFVAVSCVQLINNFSPLSTDHTTLETQTYYGLLQVLELVQMFVLGPRLILSIREYHAELVVANADAVNGMISIALQERVHVSTGHGV